MLYSLITSEIRIKLLKKFFLKSSIKFYLRYLKAGFGKSSNAIRVKLNRFEEAGLLNSQWEENINIIRVSCMSLIV